MSGADATKQNRRVYLSIVQGTRAGTAIFRLSAREPDPAGAMAALISRGMLMGDTLDLEIVTDGSKDPALRGAPAATRLGGVLLAESNLLNIAAGVRRRVITTSYDLPVGAALLLLPKAPPPAGYIVQAAWATKARELTVDLTTPAITLLGGYSVDCWLYRLNA